MTFPLFVDLPVQCVGPISVDGPMLVTCPTCEGVGWFLNVGLLTAWDGKCPTCNGGGKILVRTP